MLEPKAFVVEFMGQKSKWFDGPWRTANFSILIMSNLKYASKIILEREFCNKKIDVHHE